AEKAKPGSPRHVNDRPGVNCGGGDLVVSGDDSRARERGKDSRKHSHGASAPRYVRMPTRWRNASETMRSKSQLGGNEGERRSRLVA
ncbi:hypothetical protein X777_11930, partial [Ooceraea biroi]